MAIFGQMASGMDVRKLCTRRTRKHTPAYSPHALLPHNTHINNKLVQQDVAGHTAATQHPPHHRQALPAGCGRNTHLIISKFTQQDMAGRNAATQHPPHHRQARPAGCGRMRRQQRTRPSASGRQDERLPAAAAGRCSLWAPASQTLRGNTGRQRPARRERRCVRAALTSRTAGEACLPPLGLLCCISTGQTLLCHPPSFRSTHPASATARMLHTLRPRHKLASLACPCCAST